MLEFLEHLLRHIGASYWFHVQPLPRSRLRRCIWPAGVEPECEKVADQMKLGIAMARRSVPHPSLKLTPGSSENAALTIASTAVALLSFLDACTTELNVDRYLWPSNKHEYSCCIPPPVLYV